jgi:hypothetical protein
MNEAETDDILVGGIVRLAGWNGDRIGFGAGAPWPVPLARLAEATSALRLAILAHIPDAPGDLLANAFRLSAYHFSVTASAIAEIALGIENELTTGLVLTGVPEIDWLRGHSSTVPESEGLRLQRFAQSPLRSRFGRLARAATWSPLSRWPRAFFLPDAVAVTHNELLRSEARESGLAIGFRHADQWLSEISAADSSPSGQQSRDAAALTEAVAAAVAKAVAVSPQLEKRVAALLAGRLAALMQEALRNMRALEKAHLPPALWSGTGGYWPSRALGIEVMRRGGTVRRFDHGCGFATLVDPLGARLIELCVSTHFVAATATLADILRRQVGTQSAAQIEGGEGDPHFRRAPGPLRQNAKRLRVLYVTGAIFGLRRFWPVKITDFPYLDWQLRVARVLKTLDVDLTLKPHPEGLYRGLPHPLGLAGPVETRPFEEILDDMDVVIFDEPTSTTFWVAVASNCRVVLMNAGLAEFDSHLAPMIEDRVAMVPVFWDDSNRPQFDIAMLNVAIHDRRAVDYQPLRQLMAGATDAGRH